MSFILSTYLPLKSLSTYSKVFRKSLSSINFCKCGKSQCVCAENIYGQRSYYQPRSALSSSRRSNNVALHGILKNNKDWVAKQSATDPEFFEKAGAVHSPKFLYFGCSDARVPANLILGLGLVNLVILSNTF